MAESRQALSATTAVTVVGCDRLPAAKVLARTYLDHHPSHGFLTVVVDRDFSDFPVVGSDWLDLPQDEYLRLATRLPQRRLLDAVIPLVLRQVLGQAEVAVYLDAETQILAPFPEISQRAAQAGIVLAPWSLSPLPQDDFEPGEQDSAFDPGFLAVGRGSLAFLDFWAGLEHLPFDLIPGLFEHEIARDPGLAAGFWNLHERDAETLRFIHFTGYDPETPWLLSADCRTRPRVRITDDPKLRQLTDAYRDLLVAEGESQPYGLDRMPDGTPITDGMRELFAEAWSSTSETEDRPPHPFGDEQAFQQWLASPSSPAQRSAGLSRLAMHVWTSRPDLQVAFRRPANEDAPGFRQWCRTHGVAEGLLPQWALPADPAALKPPVDEFGVNLAGYLTAELGLGELGRIVHKVVEHAGIAVASVVEEQSVSIQADMAQPDTVGEARFPVSILAVNADFTQLLLDSHPTLAHQRYRIGLWAWELEEFPPSMRTAFGLVDEVWTISEFSRRAIEPHSPVPVKVIPVPVLDPGLAVRKPGDTTRFLFAFDFNSTGQRKNPWGLVTAFQQAFPGRDDVRLVIKAINGRTNAAAVQRLKYVIGADDRIELMQRYLGVDEFNDLYATSDAYVSLHRSEGFGLTVAEAMIRGMAVICTDYSSTTEFVDSRVGWPIPYVMTEVGPGWPPYQAEARWADPDLAEAAKAMRAIADDPAEATRRGTAAREHLLQTRSIDSAAQWMRVQLEEAYRIWRARNTPSNQSLARRVARRVINLKHDNRQMT
jgi:glycosyltransferase involved in cell wall biosynthesis